MYLRAPLQIEVCLLSFRVSSFPRFAFRRYQLTNTFLLGRRSTLLAGDLLLWPLSSSFIRLLIHGLLNFPASTHDRYIGIDILTQTAQTDWLIYLAFESYRLEEASVTMPLLLAILQVKFIRILQYHLL